ncbi:Non-specific serine/threonine protein kinase [Bertholletia excelsa]
MERVPVIGIFVVTLWAVTTKFVCYGAKNCTRSDLEALIDFKNGLNDPENRLSSWKGINCCQWRGISCNNSTGAVIAVDLHNPCPVDSLSATRYGFWNLSGEIRPSLVKLKSLKHLDLSANTFQGIPIPRFLGSLKNLEYLNLSKAGFFGKIPPNLGNLSRLEYLDLTSDIFGLRLASANLQWVTGLVSLKHFEMNEVDLSMVSSDWVEILSMLPSLTEIHLSQCGLNVPMPSFGSINFTSLEVIDVSSNSLNSIVPDWISNVSSLVYVDMSTNRLRGRIPVGLGKLSNLKYLNLALNYNLSASCLKLFGGGWGRIEVINFAANKLHGELPDYIGNMTFLTSFDLSTNNVEGGIPRSFGKLCNLIQFDLSGNNMTGTLPEFLGGTANCVSKGPLPSLMYLRLSNNDLVGKLPEWLGQLENLTELGLDFNSFEGPIPSSLGTLQNLTSMGLGRNKLNGTLPESLGQLAKLTSFDISSNHLTGIISEAHFLNLSQLKILRLGSNSFTLHVSSNWIPPFQVRNIDMSSCHLGPSFPSWLRFQEGIMFLDFSNTGLSGPIPDWFWNISSGLSLLNVSLNHLEGLLPNPLSVAPFADIDLSSNRFEGPIPLPVVEIELFSLSKNQFSGPIPRDISKSMPNLIYLSLSSNNLTGEIPKSIGEMSLLQVLDISSNSLKGSIPSSTGNCLMLKALDLGNNNLSGSIPSSLGELKQLQSLHLDNNKLSGELPSSLQNLSSLETLDLGNNKISGPIPSCFGDGNFPNLRILRLRSNTISGGLPTGLSNLSLLQVLDLAENNITDKIPARLGDLKAMAGEQKINQYLLYGNYRGRYYEESLVVSLKGSFQKYTKTLSLVTSIDLSGNNIYGVFPEDITKLTSLVALNLSRNHISGQIPHGISRMHQLGSLDLSSNNLSGEIPESMASLSFLGYLNLSNNEFTGMIPYTGHMTTFGESTFEGNPGLCGAPLDVKCQDEGSDQGKTVQDDDDDGLIDQWFYLCVGLGFLVGVLVPYLVLAMRKPWKNAYLSFVDRFVSGLPWVRSRDAKISRKQHRPR